MVFIIPTPNELFKSLTKEGWRIRAIVVERGVAAGKSEIGLRWIESGPDEQVIILKALRREGTQKDSPTPSIIELTDGSAGN